MQATIPPCQLGIDFLSKTMRYRIAQAKHTRELLVRTIGHPPKPDLLIIDATAGLGRDALILAAVGFQVTLLEYVPSIYMQLAAAMQRAKQDITMKPIIERMHLIQANAIDWLAKMHPDIVYLDPMFPPRRKSALVKQNMRLLQALVTSHTEYHQDQALLQAALLAATKRVIIKRPKQQTAPLTTLKPTFVLRGHSSCFEVYVQPYILDRKHSSAV